MVDPSISITVSDALRNGHFLSTDDNKYQAFAETEMIRVSWSYQPHNNSGQIGFSPADSHSPGVVFKYSSNSARAQPLSYAIKATTVLSTSNPIQIRQDHIAQLQQEYIDLRRRRWDNGTVPTVPVRSDFDDNYRTANYSHSDYSQGSRPWIVMHMGSVAEGIRFREVAIVGNTLAPRISSGYRRPREETTASSLHQFGYALDMNPNRAFTNQDSVRAKMLERIRPALGTTHYDSFIHATPHVHIHIERQSVGAQGGTVGI